MGAFLTRRAAARVSLALMSAALLAQPVQAQFGRMIKKATERRVEQKVDDQANVAMLVPPTFDATTIEITTARLDAYQAAMEKRQQQAAQNRAAVEALRQRANALRDSARAVDKPNERDAYERSTGRYSDCRSGVQQEIDKASEEKSKALMMQMQSNPVAAQNDPKVKRMLALMQQMAAAQQRGDTDAYQKAVVELQTTIGAATDSASIDKGATAKCGARPTMPAGMVAAARLNDRAASLDNDAREQSGRGNGVNGADVGMTDVQARMFWERVQSWLSGMRKDAQITITFTRPEYDLLVSRRGALRKAFSGSE